ncbi:MAG: FtsX-like permease family protein, partial [Pedobacter sp.]
AQLTLSIAAISEAQKGTVATEVVASTDPLFGGDMELWKQFANTVKLRLLVKMSGVPELQSFATTEFAALDKTLGFLSTDALVNPGYVKEAGRQNPLYNSLAFGSDNTRSQSQAVPTIWIFTFYDGSKISDQGRGYSMYRGFPTTQRNRLGEENLPSTVIPPAGSTSWFTGADENSPYIGVAKGPSQGQPILMASESRFLQAEAYAKGLIAGDAKTALNNPLSVILTESTAKTLFGTTDVLNKSVRYQDKENLTITAVIKDLPENSSNRFDFLMPWSFYEIVDESAKSLNWTNYSFVTMVTLAADANIDLVNRKVEALVKANTVQNSQSQPHFLYQASKLHLFGKFENGKAVGGDIEQIYLFVGLAFGILLIACINFMNMATAKSEKRAKEVGIKKTIGANRTSLILQFLTESMVLTLAAVILAIALLEICLPAFNHLLNINLGISYFNASSWIGILGIVAATGLIAGSYPAFYLSSFNPIQTLKRKITTKGFLNINLRQVLVVGQFCFAIILIISTLVI